MKFLLFVIMIFVSLLLFADGIEPTGTGTETDPYQIATLDNLLWVGTNSNSWNKYFVQTADIDASETHNWNNGNGFSPIGLNDENSFTGIYDGQDYLISELYINRQNLSMQALFGNLSQATVKNLRLMNVDITANFDVGGLAGKSRDNSAVIDCYISGEVSGNNSIGGLVGINYSGSVIDCCFSGNVIGNSEKTGALVGYNYDGANISGCFATGEVNGNNYSGGLAGVNENSAISESFCTAEVTGIDYAGGLVGWNYDNSSLTNCYCLGNVSGNNSIGGLVGINSMNSTVSKCYSGGEVSGNENVGGLIGWNIGGTIDNSFWNIEISGQISSDGGTGKTTAELQDVATYTSLATAGLDAPWDFIDNPYDDVGNEDVWNIDSYSNNDYPYLTNLSFVSAYQSNHQISHNSKSFEIFPNPFRFSTTISFQFSNEQNQQNEQKILLIYNIKGQKIRQFSISNNQLSINWDGTDDLDRYVSSGIYFINLHFENKYLIKKVMLIK